MPEKIEQKVVCERRMGRGGVSIRKFILKMSFMLLQQHVVLAQNLKACKILIKIKERL